MCKSLKDVYLGYCYCGKGDKVKVRLITPSLIRYCFPISYRVNILYYFNFYYIMQSCMLLSKSNKGNMQYNKEMYFWYFINQKPNFIYFYYWYWSDYLCFSDYLRSSRNIRVSLLSRINFNNVLCRQCWTSNLVK